MSKSRSQIRMDFDKARKQAMELDQVASELRKLSEHKFQGTLDQLSKNWTGENAAKYIGKGEVLKENITTTAESLAESAEAIREIAQTIYDAEMEAWEIAHNGD